MPILKAMDLYKEWDGTVLFENVSFEVKEGERLALFGRNGVGKTTLLQCLLGRITADGGIIQRVLPLEEWGWMEQQALADSSASLLTVVQSGSGELHRLKLEMEWLQRRMNGEAEDSSAQPIEPIMAQYSTSFERYVQLGGYEWEVTVEKSLLQLRLDKPLWDRPFSALSGGQKTRAQLAALMVSRPKFIVLDEPTNHLDEDTLEWLEHWVRNYRGTVLYVSHDRTFIDRTADAVLELEKSDCTRYTGGYSDYRKQKELELRTQETEYTKQKLEKEKLLESIRRYAEWFRQSHKAAGQNDFYRSKAKKNVSRLHAKEAALERLERDRVDKPREAAQLKMKLEGEAFAASTLLRLQEVSFRYPDGEPLFERLCLSVNRGDRIAVMGPNGVGKSTLLKLLTGEIAPRSGDIVRNPQLKTGYFAQELHHLNTDDTILDSLLKLPGMTQTEARTILGCFLFSREEVHKRIGALSMGEKCRVAFLRLLFGQSNLLVLDEPTNYLDIDTRERVEEALVEYGGAIVIVTHDRYLIRKAANRLVHLQRECEVRVYDGSYDDYMLKDRSHILTPEQQGQENECRQLELQLAQLISREEPEEAEERQRLIRDIQQLKRRIALLQKN
ncbi:ribosomal protection-like ABC-F family protein [Paenibacillus tarimensis]